MSRNMEEQLWTAIIGRNKAQFLHLLQQIPDPTGVLVGGKSILWCAALNGWWDITRQLAAHHYWPPTHTVDSIGRSVLHSACNNSYTTADTDTVRYLTNTLCLDPLQEDWLERTPLNYSRGATREYFEQLIGKLVFTQWHIYCLLDYCKQ